ncbi:MAG TPA: VanZ family protein [Chthoniobacterales bacterium]|nr:VanZ family protein [Chthoniobacterales bacterium]
MKSFTKYWLPVLLWVALIFLGSTDVLSAEHTSRIIGPILRWFDPHISAAAIAQVQLLVRKIGHLTEYAILATLLWRALRFATTAGMAATSGLTLVASALFAASDEFHQSFVPSRTSSPQDVMIDICGAIIGLVLCALFRRNKETIRSGRSGGPERI